MPANPGFVFSSSIDSGKEPPRRLCKSFRSEGGFQGVQGSIITALFPRRVAKILAVVLLGTTSLAGYPSSFSRKPLGASRDFSAGVALCGISRLSYYRRPRIGREIGLSEKFRAPSLRIRGATMVKSRAVSWIPRMGDPPDPASSLKFKDARSARKIARERRKIILSSFARHRYGDGKLHTAYRRLIGGEREIVCERT